MPVAQVLCVSSSTEPTFECWEEFYAYFHSRGLGRL